MEKVTKAGLNYILHVILNHLLSASLNYVQQTTI